MFKSFLSDMYSDCKHRASHLIASVWIINSDDYQITHYIVLSLVNAIVLNF